MASHLRIGIFGGGVVGGGVYELVQKCVSSGRFGAIGASMEIVKICVRDLSKTRDFEIKSGTALVTNYDDILGDPSINCVVELMGGVSRYFIYPNYNSTSSLLMLHFKDGQSSAINQQL